MERTDRVTKAVGVVLFLALLAYVGYYIWDSVTNKVQTALAVNMTVTVSTPASGLIVRDETVLTSAEGNMYVVAAEGKMLAAGAAVANAYDDETALNRADRIRSIQNEILRVSAALEGGQTDLETETVRSNAIPDAVVALSGAVSRNRLDSLDVYCMNLSTLLYGAETETATQEQLDSLRSELERLQLSARSDTRQLTVDRSGLFSTAVDGWESLTVDDILSVSTDRLRELEQSGESVPSTAFGKLVVSYTWYYAAALDEEYVRELSVGDGVRLNFGRNYNRDISALVRSIGPADDNGSRVVVFACNTALADTLSLRLISAEVIFSSYSGLRVPAEAIHTDDEGETWYVYVMTGLQAERKEIKIVYRDGDIALVEEGTDAASLREGNEIIVSARDLYDGKVMD